jgi:hypothetical protein
VFGESSCWGRLLDAADDHQDNVSREKSERMAEQERQLTAVPPLGGDGQGNPAMKEAYRD